MFDNAFAPSRTFIGRRINRNPRRYTVHYGCCCFVMPIYLRN